MVAQAVEAYGGIDILVNAAVIFNTKGVLDMPVAEWRQQLDVILTGAFLCSSARAGRGLSYPMAAASPIRMPDWKCTNGIGTVERQKTRTTACTLRLRRETLQIDQF